METFILLALWSVWLSGLFIAGRLLADKEYVRATLTTCEAFISFGAIALINGWI